MENSDTKNGQHEIGNKAADGATNIQANTHAKSAKKSKKKAAQGKRKKWTLRQHWQRASQPKRLKWTVEGIGVIVGLLILANYIWGNLQTMWNFHIEHAPLVVHSKPPVLVQPFVCSPQNGYLFGNVVAASVKNIGNRTALRTYPLDLTTKFVPDQKTGKPIWDKIPIGKCDTKVGQLPETFPLEPGAERSPQIRDEAGSLPPIGSGDKVQLFKEECVYYSDEYGGIHATCDTYRLYVPDTDPRDSLDAVSGTPDFVCDGAPIKGYFSPIIGGHCQE
jgi:hypothetical protein